MLSVADNEKITRTGPGTPMGEVFRRFWVPALLSSELPERDGTPVKVGLLGENLIAFRDSSGRVGLLDSRCPHRHANLYWARNEDNGLRCVYHGWKFTVDGTCVDQPAEPAESHFKDHVCAIAYQTHEAGGIVWAYLGPKDKTPPFPQFDWIDREPDQYFAHKRLQVCNYLQNLEGEVDTAHLNFLHRAFGPDGQILPPENLRRKRYFVAETPFGLACMARSDEENDQYYWRMTPFMLPSFTQIPSPIGDVKSLTAATPIDDTTSWGFTVAWHPEHQLDRSRAASPLSMEVDPVTFLPAANIYNDYQRDLDKQKHENWTGIGAIRTQDMAAQEDQDGPICRRDQEHLGVTDRAIVATRRLLLQLAEQLEQGIEPAQAQNAEGYRARSVAGTAPRSLDPTELWKQGQPSPERALVGSAT
jgi:phenylpropionate dioxygenase-like ring-hydroxylating dioxygenase large terminal subunit